MLFFWLYQMAYTCNVGDPGFNPWLGTIPWRREWQPTLVPLPRKSHGRRTLVGYSPQCPKESDTTEQLHFHLKCLDEFLWAFWSSMMFLCHLPSLPSIPFQSLTSFFSTPTSYSLPSPLGSLRICDCHGRHSCLSPF